MSTTKTESLGRVLDSFNLQRQKRMKVTRATLFGRLLFVAGTFSVKTYGVILAFKVSVAFGFLTLMTPLASIIGLAGIYGFPNAAQNIFRLLGGAQ